MLKNSGRVRYWTEALSSEKDLRHITLATTDMTLIYIIHSIPMAHNSIV